jgi:hypothetical protein
VGERWTELFRSLPAPARLAVVGALTVPLSMLFPWYSTGVGPLGLSKTGFDSFGLGQLALLLTVGAALYLVFRCATGYEPPRPLHEGSLLAAAGVWSALLIAYLMLDHPDDLDHLRYGIFIALGGALAVTVGGLRLRRDEIRIAKRRATAQK